MAGDHEKSFTYHRALARYASKIGDLDIAERSYKLANGQRLSELRDVIRQHGFVIDLDESRGDFTFIETTKI